MKAETRIVLVKELEKLKSIKERNNYIGAFIGLIFSFSCLVSIYPVAVKGNSSVNTFWIPFVVLVSLIVLLQSFFIIIRHITNKKFITLFEALLEIKDTLEEKSEIDS